VIFDISMPCWMSNGCTFCCSILTFCGSDLRGVDVLVGVSALTAVFNLSGDCRISVSIESSALVSSVLKCRCKSDLNSKSLISATSGSSFAGRIGSDFSILARFCGLDSSDSCNGNLRFRLAGFLYSCFVATVAFSLPTSFDGLICFWISC
jgi:hypothetical protein